MMSARIAPGGDEPGSIPPDIDDPAASCESRSSGRVRVSAPPDALSAAQRLEWELEVFKRLAAGEAHVSVWQSQPALAVTAREASLPLFPAAAAASARRGFPVHVRSSGGGCVCLGPGTLVISHLYCAADQSVERAYRDFAAKLLAAAARLRTPLRIGQAGAAGEPRGDLSCKGLKVGGIAQRHGASTGLARVWVHAVLAVEECASSYPQQVRAFYRDLGAAADAGPDLTTVLARCVPPQWASGLISRLSEDLVRLFALPASPARAAFSRSLKDGS